MAHTEAVESQIPVAHSPLPPRCPSWGDHDWSGSVIHATGYIPFKGWFRTEHQICRICGVVQVHTLWIPKENRALQAGVDGQE